LKETIDDVLENKKIGLVRADSGFYTDKILDFLEQKELHFSRWKKALWGI